MRRFQRSDDRALKGSLTTLSDCGSLLWDGEHRFPNNVTPKPLRPTKAW
jgi:hypothetical protein